VVVAGALIPTLVSQVVQVAVRVDQTSQVVLALRVRAMRVALVQVATAAEAVVRVRPVLVRQV